MKAIIIGGSSGMGKAAAKRVVEEACPKPLFTCDAHAGQMEGGSCSSQGSSIAAQG